MGIGTVNVPGLGRSGIPEAPLDGEKYLRQSGAWSALTEIGNLANLATTAKTDLVAAINEIVSFSKALKEGTGAGLHNSIYRGKYLGDHVTAEQWAAIQAGTFDDLWVGDYWTIGGHNWRIADFDYFHFGNGAHHIVIVPDSALYQAKMNDTNTTEGGYAGSKMHTTNLEQAKTLIANAFGAAHIMRHELSFSNTVTNGVVTGVAQFECTVELMSERMVYGCSIASGNGFNGTTYNVAWTEMKSQLALFRHRADMIGISGFTWLYDVGKTDRWCCLYDDLTYCGIAHYGAPSAEMGVRPYVCIYQATA